MTNIEDTLETTNCVLFLHRFDHIFDQATKQEDIFNQISKPVIEKYVFMISITLLQ